MTTLNNDDYTFLQAMSDAVESEDVGYIYKQASGTTITCTYLPTDETNSCIVGRGVLDGGFATPATLEPFEGKSASQVLVGDKTVYNNIEPVSERTAMLHPDVVKVADYIQSQQDSGMPWTVAWNMGVMFLVGKGHDVEYLIDSRVWPNDPNE